MTEFENIVVKASAVPALILSIVVLCSLPVVAVIYWKMRHKEQTKISWLIAGAVGFVVSARVLELGVHYVCIIMDNPVSRFINGHTFVFALYGALMAGVFEECGRYVIIRFLLKKNRTRENAVFYGLAHGGIEVLIIVVPLMITYLSIAQLFSAGDTQAALSALKITEENASAALPSVQAAASFGFGMMGLNVIERVIAMTGHIGFTVIVYYGVVNGRKGYLPLAILLHMLMDIGAALYQKGALPLWFVEVWGALGAIVTLFLAVRLYRRLDES
ncbi:MAG: YhfC family intramembrane metalloprotease [Lachnospiraceae bacterium]|nr:YhfC family intramembrane metalloprotease [Lachnospiraceae bacterium]